MALKWLRDQMKYLTWVLWIIVAAFIFALFFDFGAADFSRSQNQVAATVGEEKITYEEFRRQYQNLESRYRQMFGEQWTPEMAERFNLPKQALDQLIDRRIRLMEADRIGLKVTDNEVTQAILEFPAFQDENGKFIGREEVQKLLRANRISDSQFAEDLRSDLLGQKLQGVLASNLFVSDEDVKNAYRETVEKADIQFVELPASSLTEVTADDAEVEAFFAEEASKYEVPEQRSIDYILVDTVKMRREMEIPEDEIRQYYDDNQEKYTKDEQVMASHILLRTDSRGEEGALAEAQALLARAQAGEDFATLARENSDDEGSAQRGGNLGMFSRNQMLKPFEDAAFNAEVGDIVGPVQTQYGYHVIKKHQHVAGGVQDFELVKPSIKNLLLGPRVDEMAEDKAKEIAAKIKADGLTESDQLKQLAEEHELTFETAASFDRNTPIPGLGASPAFFDAVYALKEAGEMSEPLKMGRGWVISRLAEIKAPRIPELSEVQDDVRRDLQVRKQKDAAVERLAEAKTTLAEGGLQAVADEFGLELRTSGSLGTSGSINGLNNSREVLTAAMSMEVGDVSDPIATDNGAVLFEVLDRTKFDNDEFEESKAATRDAEVGRRLSQVLGAVVEQRRRDLSPKYDARVVEDFGIQNES